MNSSSSASSVSSTTSSQPPSCRRQDTANNQDDDAGSPDAASCVRHAERSLSLKDSAVSALVMPRLPSLSDAEALLLEPKQPRVLLWAVPRSISTAFFRAIMEGARIKVLLEPFSNAYYFGEERVSARYASRPPTPGARFADITALYEAPYPRYRSVFAKDMAYYLRCDAESLSRLLPRGYTHTFLIRHPAASVASLYRLSTDKQRTGWDWFNAAEAGFRELHALFQHVTQRLGQPAVVVDADDLIRQPRHVLIRYCALTGLEFSDKMLSWRSIDYSLVVDSSAAAASPPQEVTGVVNTGAAAAETNLAEAAERQLSIAPQIFRGWGPWFEGVLSSTSFREFSLPASSTAPSSSPQHVASAADLSTNKAPASASTTSQPGARQPLPAKVQECIAECLPYYEYLRKFKI